MKHIPLPSIAAESLEQVDSVERLALVYGLRVCPLNQQDSGWLLVKTAERLELRQLDAKAPGPIFTDFVGGKNAHRRQFGGGRNQPLARAVGLKKNASPSLLDVTAGMGKDAFVLAFLGCKVTMIERSPVVAALLADGLIRGAQDKMVAEIINRMTLHHSNAIEYLNALDQEQAPEVIYMDPMYPHRQKSARVKKEMRLFQQLVGADNDSDTLLKSALRVAKRRVVVKRPAKSSALSEIIPDASSASPNTRYDLYFQGMNP